MTLTLRRRALAAAAALLAFAPFADTARAQPRADIIVERLGLPVVKVQACGYYVIMGCFRSRGPANRQRSRTGAMTVVDTNQYPNFRNGYYCAADGPFPTDSQISISMYRQTVSDAYVKYSC